MPSVLATSAAHGIGLAAARLFAKNGYRVAALDVDGGLDQCDWLLHLHASTEAAT